MEVSILYLMENHKSNSRSMPTQKYQMLSSNCKKITLTKKKKCSPSKEKCNCYLYLDVMVFWSSLTRLIGNLLRRKIPFYKTKIKFHSSLHFMEDDIINSYFTLNRVYIDDSVKNKIIIIWFKT